MSNAEPVLLVAECRCEHRFASGLGLEVVGEECATSLPLCNHHSDHHS